MNGSFSARAVSLGALLSGEAAFAIPGFQRPYSWTIVEAARLLDDILFAVNETEAHAGAGRVFFLGTVVLIRNDEGASPTSGPRHRTRYDVVDGQQRLVTLTMLLAVLRDLARSEGETDLASAIDLRIATHDDENATARSNHVTLRASDAQVLVNFAQQIDGCQANADPADFEGAQRNLIANRNYLFEELQALDAGMRRRIADFLDVSCQMVVISTDDTDNAFRIFMVVNQVGKPLLRNDLLKAELIGALAEHERPAAIARWEALEGACAATFEQFFSHLRAAFGSGRAPIINEVRRLARLEGGAREFLARRLFPAASIFAAMRGRVIDGPVFNAPALQSLRNLDRLSHTDWIPPALLWAFECRDDPAATAEFLASLDRFAHGQLVLGIGRDKRLVRYGALIEAIRKGGRSLDVPGQLRFNAEEQRNILFNVSNDLYGRSSIGCKLLLLLLNAQMGGAAPLVDPTEISVEHILPQKVARNSLWRNTFDDAALAAYRGSLGNLALVTPETNRAVRNFDFEKKCAFYRQDPLMRSLPVNQGILDLPSFGPEEIKAREDRLVALLMRYWGFAEGGRRPLREIKV